MKILFVFNHQAPYKVNLINELSKYHDIDIIFERTKNKNRHPLFYGNIPLQAKQIKIKGFAFGEENHFSFALKNYIKQHYKNYNLIVMNGYSTMSEIIAIKYMIKREIPYSLYINGGVIHSDSKSRYKLKKQLISGALNYFSPCQVADKYLIHYGALKDDIHHYTYATVFYHDLIKQVLDKKEKNKLRKTLTLQGKKIFITAGQFIERKNNLQLLEIWKDQPQENTLYLIGDGPLKNVYENFIKNNDMQNVFILPFMSQPMLFEYFRAADAFITLSKEDIYGHVVNEAFSQALPVISSDKVVSALHLIKNSFNGFIVSLDDDLAIKEAIGNDFNSFMSVNALNTAQKNTIEIMIQDHLAIIKEINK